MKLLHVVGKRNHGKTTLVVELLRELTARGLRVGTIKHSSHAHELDTPGKDSFRHRQAGAEPAAIITHDLIGLYLPRHADTDFYARLAPMFTDCDLVVVEGHLAGPGVKIEVWRREKDDSCLASGPADIAAVVTDDPLELDLPIWPRSDVAQLAGHVLTLI